MPQGISADLIATLEGFSREELDAFALESQRKAAGATRSLRLRPQPLPGEGPATGAVLLEKDEHPRHDTTLEGLAALKPAFVGWARRRWGPNGETLDQIALERYPAAQSIQHVHTAGNSPAASWTAPRPC